MEAFELLLEALGAHYRCHLGLCSEVRRVVLKAVQVFEQRDRYEQLRVIMLVVKSSGGENGNGKWPVERHRRDQAWLKVSL